MTKLRSINFEAEAIRKLKSAAYTKDWPVVYILEDGKEAYVGETTSALSRFKQHYENPDRKRMRRAHVLIDDQYNKSATLDTEALLIQYMVADGKFTLQNKNGGLVGHSYYDKENYRAKFEMAWEDLQRKGLAQKDLIQLRNSDIFKYSPYKALTEEQIHIAEKIKSSLANGIHATYVINGSAGTGKSVLASYLVKFLRDASETRGLEVALVVPMTSLRTTLKKVFSKIKGLNAGMVIAPSDVIKKDYDVIIVDEAHRLRRRVNLSGYSTYDATNKHFGLGNEGTQLDWIMRGSKSQILLYDANQSVMPGDIRPEQIAVLDAVRFDLTSQLRVLAGNDYIEFIDNVFSLNQQDKPDFGDYDLCYFDSAKEMIDVIKQRDVEHGLARTVAGYAWDWKTKNDSNEKYDIELEDIKLKWNGTNIDWVNSPNANNEIGCIHTIQGYDLNFVGVIIGPELSYDAANNRLIVDKKKYKDFNGRRSIESQEELESYVINIYKTLLTRGIKGTYIHAVDPALEKYLLSRLNVKK